MSDPRGTRNCAGVVVSRDLDGTWWYWWAHAERIGAVDDPDQAARRVARVICGITEQAGTASGSAHGHPGVTPVAHVRACES